MKHNVSISNNHRLRYYYQAVLVAVISIFIVFASTYFFMRNLLVNRMIEDSANNLLFVIDTQEAILNQAERILNTLAMDSKTIDFIKYRDKKASEQYNIYQKLSLFKSQNELFQQIAVYYLQEEKVLATDWGASSAEDFTNFNGKKYKYIKPSKGLIVKSEASFSQNRDGSIELLLYAPINYLNEPKAMISITLSSEFFRSLQKSMDSLGGAFFLVNSTQDLIYGSGGSDSVFDLSQALPDPSQTSDSGVEYVVSTINGREMLISRAHSSAYELTYIHSIPVSEITADVDFLIYLLVIVVILMVLLSAIGAWGTIRQIFKPFDSINGLLGTDGEAEEVHLNSQEMAKSIHRVFEQNRYLSIQNKNMEEKLEKNKLRQKNVFLFELLTGRYILSDLAKDIPYYEVPFSAKAFFCVLLVSIEESDNDHIHSSPRDRGLFTLLLSELTKKLPVSGPSIVAVETGSREYCLILSEETKEYPLEEFAAEAGKSLLYNMAKNVGMSISIGISASSQGIDTLTSCYRQAQSARDRCFIYGTNRIYSFQIEQISSLSLPYPHDIERKLIAALKGKNREKVFEYTEQFYYTVTNTPMINITIVQHCFLQLFSVIYHCIYECFNTFWGNIPSEQAIYGELLKNQPSEKYFQQLHGFLEFFFDEIKESHAERYVLLVDQVKEYINQHYQNEITIDSISSVFLISPSHLRRVFKDVTGGTSIKRYIDIVRMEQAKQLLISSTVPVNDVALRTGYISLQTFLRVFRKEFSTSPTEFRRQNMLAQQTSTSNKNNDPQPI